MISSLLPMIRLSWTPSMTRASPIWRSLRTILARLPQNCFSRVSMLPKARSRRLCLNLLYTSGIHAAAWPSSYQPLRPGHRHVSRLLIQREKEIRMANYSMWVLEYAHVPTQAIGSVLAGQYNQGVRLLAFGYMVLKGEGNT